MANNCSSWLFSFFVLLKVILRGEKRAFYNSSESLSRVFFIHVGSNFAFYAASPTTEARREDKKKDLDFYGKPSFLGSRRKKKLGRLPSKSWHFSQAVLGCKPSVVTSHAEKRGSVRCEAYLYEKGSRLRQKTSNNHHVRHKRRTYQNPRKSAVL